MALPIEHMPTDVLWKTHHHAVRVMDEHRFDRTPEGEMKFEVARQRYLDTWRELDEVGEWR